MDLNAMVVKLKGHPRAKDIGMIAIHVGLVRGSSRQGPKVEALEVKLDHDAITKIIHDIKSLEGIIDVLVETNEGLLGVGDTILSVALAGDIREHVFPALEQAVDRIKKEATKKREHRARVVPDMGATEG